MSSYLVVGVVMGLLLQILLRTGRASAADFAQNW